MIDQQIPMRLGEEVDQVRAENARLREENKAFESDVETIAAHNIELQEQLAAAQATIEQMRGAIGAWERAEAGQELQEAEAKLIAAMNTENNLDALHEARAAECERLAEVFEPGWIKNMLDREAAAHRARKEEK